MLRTIDRFKNLRNITTVESTQVVPLLSIRNPKTDNDLIIQPRILTVVGIGGLQYYYGFFVNPVITGFDSASWENFRDILEFDFLRTESQRISRLNNDAVVGGFGVGVGIFEYTGEDFFFRLKPSEELIIGVMTLPNATQSYTASLTGDFIKSQ